MRFNVQNPKTGQWRCFSSIIDNFITDWMNEDEYEKWRKLEYGTNFSPAKECNLMSMEEALEIILKRDPRYEDFTFLDEPIPFNEFAKDKNIDPVQVHPIINHNGNLFAIFGGSFTWRDNVIKFSDGDNYNLEMKIVAYEWFTNPDFSTECGLDIIVGDDW